MVKLDLPKAPPPDPTLVDLDEAIVKDAKRRDLYDRTYLGASAIGHACDRKLWYGFRWASEVSIGAQGRRAINDGHEAEKRMAKWLRLLPYIQLWTCRDDDPMRQISFVDHSGHFSGNADGVILGLRHAPETPHIWEHKACNERKQGELYRAKSTYSEGEALKHWDKIYYAQAQLYMHYFGIDWHWLTCDSPGSRSTISVTTPYDSGFARQQVLRGYRTIFADRIPERISDKPDWWICKNCDHRSICHQPAGEVKFPRVHCRTCMHAVPLERMEESKEADGVWWCSRHKRILKLDESRIGCEYHLFHVDFVPGQLQKIKDDRAYYRLSNQTDWIDGV